jgi:hypothetical protein
MMALILGDPTDPVGEGQRVGKARKVEESLERKLVQVAELP